MTASLGGLQDSLSHAPKHDSDVALIRATAFSGTRWLQVSDGQAAAVETTLAEIGTDPRHDNIEVVTRRPITSRSFEAWSLASPTVPRCPTTPIELAISACEADCDDAILLRSIVMIQLPDGRLLAA